MKNMTQHSEFLNTYSCWYFWKSGHNWLSGQQKILAKINYFLFKIIVIKDFNCSGLKLVEKWFFFHAVFWSPKFKFIPKDLKQVDFHVTALFIKELFTSQSLILFPICLSDTSEGLLGGFFLKLSIIQSFLLPSLSAITLWPEMSQSAFPQ